MFRVPIDGAKSNEVLLVGVGGPRPSVTSSYRHASCSETPDVAYSGSWKVVAEYDLRLRQPYTP